MPVSQQGSKHPQMQTVFHQKSNHTFVLFLFPCFTLTFNHLADAFIQSDLQMRTMEAIKINKREIICKCYDKPHLA